VGSFRDKNHAEESKKTLEKRYRPVSIKKFESTEGKYYRVLVGEYQPPRSPIQVLQELRSLHYDGLIVRLDP